MPTKPSDVFSIAQQLRANSQGEAALRSAVSRAYYAALLRANEVLPERENAETQGGESSHLKIIGRAKVCSVAPGNGRQEAAQIAKSLGRMKQSRVKADYYLDQTVTVLECDELIARAKDALSHCEEFVRKRQAALVSQAPPSSSSQR